MTRITSSLIIATLLGLFLHIASAQAQLVRTCVSMAKGSDANASTSCHCTTPCRTFATAHNNTLSDGEITVLDPGDYGGLTITKSISINNDSGGEASITVAGAPGGTTGIIVNAPNGAGYVNLRGITIQGVGFGSTRGLRFNSGFSLTMTNCVVRNHTNDGIIFQPTGNSTLAISNTLVADNGFNGIAAGPDRSNSGIVKIAFSRVEVSNNGAGGIVVDGSLGAGTTYAAVEDSVVANNAFSGFAVESSAGHATVNLMIVRSVVANNGGIGLFVDAPAPTALRIGQSAITGNNNGWNATGGAQLVSYGDNVIDGNGDGGLAPPTIVKK
jgi:Right handed beta helix region